ncbi:hypothetical protein ABBQ38_004843 [Trebouxia sp. C0009 RCD-2024]
MPWPSRCLAKRKGRSKSARWQGWLETALGPLLAMAWTKCCLKPPPPPSRLGPPLRFGDFTPSSAPDSPESFGYLMGLPFTLNASQGRGESQTYALRECLSPLAAEVQSQHMLHTRQQQQAECEGALAQPSLRQAGSTVPSIQSTLKERAEASVGRVASASPRLGDITNLHVSAQVPQALREQHWLGQVFLPDLRATYPQTSLWCIAMGRRRSSFAQTSQGVSCFSSGGDGKDYQTLRVQHKELQQSDDVFVELATQGASTVAVRLVTGTADIAQSTNTS